MVRNRHVIIFGRFGGILCVTIAHKLDRVATSVLAKAKSTAHTKNTITHNNQDELPPPYPPAACPSPTMGWSAVPSIHVHVAVAVALAPYGPILGACYQVGQCHGWLTCLGSLNKRTKNSVLVGLRCPPLNAETPQSTARLVVDCSRGEVGDELWLGGIA